MLRRWLVIGLVFIFATTCFSQIRSLGYFVQQGLENSPLLKNFYNQVRINSLDSLIVKSTRVPQVNFNGLLSYAPVVNGYGYNEAITNGGNLISVMNVSQTVFNKKTIDAQFAKIALQSRSAVNASTVSERDLRRAITAQYLAVCSVFSDITFEKQLISQGRDEEKMLAGMVQNGLYKQTEYLSFLLELESLELQLGNSQMQYLREISGLNRMCGMSDTSGFEPVIPDLALKISDKDGGSPFFQQFTIDSLVIQNDRLLTERNYKPKMAWFADAGLVTNDPALIGKNFGLSMGVSFSMPVYDGNQRKLNFEKLRTSELTWQNYRNFFKVQYNQQLRQLFESLKLAIDLIPRFRRHLDLAETIVRQNKQLLNNGGISITDFVIAVKNYEAIQANLNQYQIRVLQIINEINYWKD